MHDIYVNKLPLENLPGESIAVCTTWADDSFSVKIFYDDKAWNKTTSEADLKQLSGFTQHSIEEYLKETRRALTCDGGCEEFTYNLTRSEFIWKKIVDNIHNIKVKFGSLQLEEMPVSSFVETAVCILINRCKTLKEKNKSLKRQNEDLRAANTSLRTHVCSITQLKMEMEETLYTKAVAVLNAKKEKIGELERIVQTRPTTSETFQNSGHKVEDVEIDPSSKDLYGSETEIDTDENSDFEYPEKRSTPSMNAVARGEKEKELLPTASKTQKLEHISSGIPSDHLTKGPPESEDDDDDIPDNIVHVRRKKNIKSRISH